MTSCMFEYPHAAAEEEGFAQSKQTVTTSRNLRGNLSPNCEFVVNLITVDTCLCLRLFVQALERFVRVLKIAAILGRTSQSRPL